MQASRALVLRPEFTFAPEAQPFAPEAQPFEIRDVFGLLHSHQRANGWDPKRLIEKFENFATVRPPNGLSFS